MLQLPTIPAKLRNLRPRAGFTMIELLIVIAILGILAVAVLSAINPVEQINRGRDTGSRSDAEQLLSAIDRFNAFKGYYPWQVGQSNAVDSRRIDGENQVTAPSTPTEVMAEINDAGPLENADNTGTIGTCKILQKLGSADDATCPGTGELKESFGQRITQPSYNELYIYNAGTTGASTYVCFEPQSLAFKDEAEQRCGTYTLGSDPAWDGMPVDMDADIVDFICGDNTESNPPMVCLP